jgi:hypothetical protein
VSLDGRLLRRARPFPCATVSDPAAGLLGLVVRRTRVVEPESGRTVLRSQVAILAVAGRRLLLRAGRRALMLIDNETGRKRAVPWPSALEGLDDAVVDPGGRFVALSFAAPSWPGGKQVMDAWLLDTQTGRLAQLPAMPAFVALKATSLAWRADGQLVLLGEDERRQFVALWRPGQRRLAFKLVRFPKRRGDSDSFAPLG